MPLVYADTSALYAFFHPRDEFTREVTAAVRELSPEFVYWPFLRYELRHNLRQARTDSYGTLAWNALRAAERTHARMRWSAELIPEPIIEAADELSAQRATESDAGSSDFIHVSAARRLRLLSGLDEFWTCDGDQARLASRAGLKVRLFRPRTTPTKPAGA